MTSYPSDLSLIQKVKKTRDEDSLLQLIERHSGIYHSMVNHFMSHPQNALDKSQMVDEKDSTIYSAALNYDPTRKTKFSTHLANQTKWKCLNLLNKNKRNREFFIDESENYYEPSCESFLAELKKEEVFSLFKKCLEKEKDERVKKIIDIRYDTPDNKLTPWRKISKSLDMSIQGCINIHNRFLEKVKRHIKNV
jgi:DNA-directed RNA polymerase specialized sigma24 family protein